MNHSATNLALKSLQPEPRLIHANHRVRGGQIDTIENAIRMLLSASGADLDDPHLAETPRRAAEAYSSELLSGYRMNAADLLKAFEEPSHDPVLVRRIPFYSLCAHHVLPFFGTASVVYKPNGKVLGLSKIGRLIDCFARRLQVQERLTREIADALQTHLEPKASVVVMRAEHVCMSMRGIRHTGSETVTCAVRGTSKVDIEECRSLMQMILGQSLVTAEGRGEDAGHGNW